MLNIFKTADKEISEIVKNKKFSKLFSDIFKLIEINQSIQLEEYIGKNIDYLISNEGIINLKKLIDKNGTKYYPILWSIFFVSTTKKNYELANLFLETTEISEKLLKEIKKLKKENYDIKLKISKLEGIIKILETENSMLQEESKHLRPSVKIYSEILKILIENNLLEKGENAQEVIEGLIKTNDALMEYIDWLEKEGIIMKKDNGGYGLSPKIKNESEKIKSNEKLDLKHKKNNKNLPQEIENTKIIKSPGKIKKPEKIKKYKFKQIDNLKQENKKKEEEIKQKIDNLKQENEKKENKIKKQAEEIERQAEEIERLKRELEDIKKNSGKTNIPAHIVEKAHKSYEENK